MEEDRKVDKAGKGWICNTSCFMLFLLGGEKHERLVWPVTPGVDGWFSSP